MDRKLIHICEVCGKYEPFRHWSDGGSVYILSDLHFDDADCKFMSPDWITPLEQVAIINGMVMKNDTLSRP